MIDKSEISSNKAKSDYLQVPQYSITNDTTNIPDHSHPPSVDYHSVIENHSVLSESQSSVNMTDIQLTYFLKRVSAIAIPGMLFYLFLVLLQVLNLISIGQKYDDDDMIKGIGISNLYMNCTMFAIILGLVSGIDTLCANAFAVKRYKLMGLYVHKARIIGYIATIVIVTIHIFTVDKVLKLFSLNDNVIRYSLRYIYSCLIFIFFDVQTACNFRFLNVIRKAHVNFIVLIIGAAFHPLWNYIFITRLDLDVAGAGISFTISRFVICVCSSIYVHCYNPIPESNFCINRACFKGLWTYLKFSIGAAFLLCAEWWAFEIQAFIAISISEDDYTVHIIIAQLASLLYSVTLGFSLALTIITGEYIAKSTVKITKKAAWMGLIFAFTVMLFVVSIFFIFRVSIMKLFINKEPILDKGVPVMILLLTSQLFDVTQSMIASVFRGLGKQFVASVLTFFQFYLMMTSLSYVLGKVLGMGVFGMWIGINAGYATAIVLYLIVYVCFLDLNKIQLETRMRIERDNKTAEEEKVIEAMENETLIPN